MAARESLVCPVAALFPALPGADRRKKEGQALGTESGAQRTGEQAIGWRGDFGHWGWQRGHERPRSEIQLARSF